jgi:hypothetical protein
MKNIINWFIAQKTGVKILLVLAVLSLIGIALPKEQKEVVKQSDQKIISKSIPGLSPGDIHLNFEKKGFSIEKNITSDGSTWTNKKSINGIDYQVVTYCNKGVNAVDNIRVWAMRSEPQLNKVEDMKAFLKYSVSIPYDGYDQNKVNEFIDNNYYNKNSSIVISGVKFTLSCPTEFVRQIDIEKE